MCLMYPCHLKHEIMVAYNDIDVFDGLLYYVMVKRPNKNHRNLKKYKVFWKGPTMYNIFGNQIIDMQIKKGECVPSIFWTDFGFAKLKFK